MRTFFDTNVLVYLYDNEYPDKKARAQELFESECGAGRTLLSTQVLKEFYVTVTRKLAIPLALDAAEEVVRHLTELPIVTVGASVILSAIARSRAASLSFWDALIVEAALRGGADRLLTEDLQHGQHIEGLVVENPFQHS